MKFEGTVETQASRQEVWRFLSDPAAVGQCLPGLQTLRPVVPGKQYRMELEVDLGFLQPTFELDVFLTSSTPDRQARLWLRGKGPDSHVGGSSYVVLNDLGGGRIELQWTFFIAAAGWITSLGEWLLANAFRRLSRGFVERVHQRLGDRVAEAVPSLVPAEGPVLRVAV